MSEKLREVSDVDLLELLDSYSRIVANHTTNVAFLTVIISEAEARKRAGVDFHDVVERLASVRDHKDVRGSFGAIPPAAIAKLREAAAMIDEAQA